LLGSEDYVTLSGRAVPSNGSKMQGLKSQFIIGRATYRVEVMYCYSNPKSPWVAQAYSEQRSGWKCIPDFPWAGEKNEEAAIRAALFPTRTSVTTVEIKLTHPLPNSVLRLGSTRH
jgi:hypothetical protein